MRYDAGIVDCTEPETPMPTRPLDRLLFVQGGLCFFCKQPLLRDDASVEHLQAIANGGANGDDNCVACCKTVNALLGSMSIKPKFEVVLNQKGHFRCSNHLVATPQKESTTELLPAPASEPELQTSHRSHRILSGSQRTLPNRSRAKSTSTRSLLS